MRGEVPKFALAFVGDTCLHCGLWLTTTHAGTYSQGIPHMHVDPWRLVVKLKSRRALLEFMEFHNLSARGLAKKAGLKPAIVGHLVRDPHRPSSRSTCSYKTARAIEAALECPPGFLFDTSLSPVADSKPQPVRSAA
jgi:hypothetical protein